MKSFQYILKILKFDNIFTVFIVRLTKAYTESNKNTTKAAAKDKVKMIKNK